MGVYSLRQQIAVIISSPDRNRHDVDRNRGSARSVTSPGGGKRCVCREQCNSARQPSGQVISFSCRCRTIAETKGQAMTAVGTAWLPIPTCKKRRVVNCAAGGAALSTETNVTSSRVIQPACVGPVSSA